MRRAAHSGDGDREANGDDDIGANSGAGRWSAGWHDHRSRHHLPSSGGWRKPWQIDGVGRHDKEHRLRSPDDDIVVAIKAMEGRRFVAYR
jgi:hypothetical protein